jgi:hypothetical protein
MHNCPECGLGHESAAAELAAAEPAPVVVEPAGPNENDVKIAEVNAAADVELATISAESRNADLEEENARLRGELAGMKDTLATLAPPEPAPAPPPVPVQLPEPAPAALDVAPPPPVSPAPEGKKGGKATGWWDGYR